MGIELLTNSDNVLRGGLTSKYVDHKELLKILNYFEYKPEIMRAPETPHSWFSYPAGEFALSVMYGSGAAIPYTENGPSILIITEGNAVVDEGGAEGGIKVPLKKGESVFIPAGKNPVFSGAFTAYAASCRSS